MKFNIPSKVLLARINAVSKVIKSKNAYAILDNFLFEVTDQRLYITGSDMETRMVANAEITEADQNGKFAVDVKRILNLIRELPDTALTFDVNLENNEVKISYFNGEYCLSAIDGEQFPVKAAGSGEPRKFSLPAKAVVNGLQNTIFAVGVDEMRPQFTGIFWDIKIDMVVFVASDSHKLVRYKALDAAPGIEASFILPAKPASILSSVLERNSADPILVTFDDNSATFDTQTFSLSCRFVKGNYPNYEKVIANNNPYDLLIERSTFLNAVRRVSALSPDGALVKLKLEANSIHLNAEDIDHATSGVEHITCEYSGEPMTMGFKSTDLINVLNNIDAEQVNIKLLDPTRAGLFLPSEQKAGEDLLILQMPMMI